jgi:hypothetical protein
MRREAVRRRVSLSRYAKERLTPAQDAADAVAAAPNSEPRRDDGLHKLIVERTEGLADHLGP